MKKRFHSKKRILKGKKLTFKAILILFSLILLIFFLSNYLSKFKIATSNEEFIKYMLNDSNHYHNYNPDKNIFDKALLYIANIDTEVPATNINQAFYYVDNELDDNVVAVNNYIENPTPEEIDNPRVYIYNTHQYESYHMNNLEPYNITPNVIMTSYLLEEKLNNNNINTVVDETNISEYMINNNILNKDYYQASREILTKTLEQYPNIDLYIDIHRDAISKEKSTVVIDDKSYAKVMFVIGKEHTNYENNLAVTNKLNDLIKSKYPTLTRGVLVKEGENVDGKYNQDLNGNIILIEVGAYMNTIDEVNNTTDILTEVITEYLGGI